MNTVAQSSVTLDNSLRVALRLDALVSAAFAALVLIGGPMLVDLLGASLTLLWSVGVAVLVWSGALWWVQLRARINPRAVWTIIALNLMWALESVLLVVLGWVPLTGLGVAFVLLQAAAVLGLTDLQFVGLRRALYPGQARGD
jgi:hypothetical protein